MATKTALKEPKGRLVNHVYERLRRKVIALELKPGEFLDEKKLMEELGVGRTPLRESIVRLKTEGLIEGEPNKTPYVREVSLKDSLDLTEALLIVEKNVTFLAAQRITEPQLQALSEVNARMDKALKARKPWDINTLNHEFHGLIAQAGGNKCLHRVHQDIRNQVLRLSYLVLSIETRGSAARAAYYQELQHQHHALLDCLQRRELAKVERICADHIALFKDQMLNCTAGTQYL